MRWRETAKPAFRGLHGTMEFHFGTAAWTPNDATLAKER